MSKIRRDDIVQVMKGKDKGKKGKVMRIILEKNRAIVERINLVKKHMRQKRQDQPGGIVSIEAAVNISNLSLFCKHCNRPARAGFKILGDGTKARFCKKCKEVI